jgi:hypothetical protein
MIYARVGGLRWLANARNSAALRKEQAAVGEGEEMKVKRGEKLI